MARRRPTVDTKDTAVSPKKIRDSFPFFTAHPDAIYLDNSATTQKPQLVIDTLNTYYIKIMLTLVVRRILYHLNYRDVSRTFAVGWRNL